MLQDKFQFIAYGGDTLYTAVKQGDIYRVSWEVEDHLQDQGYAPYNIDQVEKYVKGGEWTVVNSNPEAESNINYFAEIGGTQIISSGTGGWTLQTDGKLSLSGIGLGVARPVLETRKIGKERIELFDDGFPNAIREIVRVMTWAQEVKQYGDHDWKNLPNPENTLSGAASRHRNDHNIQKSAGVPPLERVDHESKKVHLAHQAFNVLAELELLITGKIK